MKSNHFEDIMSFFNDILNRYGELPILDNNHFIPKETNDTNLYM